MFSGNEFDPSPLVGCALFAGAGIGGILLILGRFLVNHVHITWH
jgi:hypothetical protein